MKLKICEIVSNVDHLTEERIQEAVKNNAIDEWAYILHDHDIKEDGSPKPAHWHVDLRLKDAYDSKYVSSWFGVPDNFVSNIKGKRFIHGCKYLIHKNAPDRYQYEISKVISNFNFKKFIEDDESGKSGKLSEITDKIVSGEIKRWNINKYVTPKERQQFYRKIEIAFEIHDENYSDKESRQMEVIYVQGVAGIGKTTFAKEYAKNRCDSVFVSSGSNDPFDGYKGEEAVILDDAKPEDFRIGDLLKITDNHTSSTVKSRYFNKRLYCKLMIITSVRSIKAFYDGTEGHEEGLESQFTRRCSRLFIMKPDGYDIYYYDKESRKHCFMTTHKGNTIAEKVREFKAKTLSEQLEEDVKFFKTITEISEVKNDS